MLQGRSARDVTVRVLFFVGLAALLLVCATLLKRTVPFEIQTLLDRQNPVRQQYEADLASFNDEGTGWLMVERSAAFAPGEIQTLSDRIGKRLEMDSAFEAIVGPQNAKYFEFDERGFQLIPFLQNGEWTAHARAHLNDEMWKNGLIRDDDRAFLMSYRFRRDLVRRDEKPAVDRLESFLTQLREETPGLRTALLGAKVASASFLGEMKFQQQIITPLLLLALGVFLWFCYRSVQIVAWNFFVMFVCYASTLCLIILIEGGLGPYSSFSLMFAFIVATTDLVHFFGRFQQLDGTIEERLVKTREIAFVPCLLTSLTTAAGFLALIVNQNLPIRYFGVYCAFSCLLEWFVIFWLLPPLLLAFRFNPGTFRWKLPQVANAIGPFLKRNANIAVATSLILIVVSLVFSLRLKIDDNFYTKFVAKHPLSRAIDLFSDQFNFVGSIDVVTKLGSREIDSSETLRDLRDMESELARHPVVSKLTSYRQVQDELSKAVEGQSPDPLKRDQLKHSVTQMLLDYDVLRDVVNESSHELRTVVFLRSLSTDDLNSVLATIENLKEKYKTKFEIRAAGFSVIRAFINGRVIRDFLESFALSFFLIFLCYLWLYRSAKWSLIALFPNALPLVAVSGLMGLFKVPVDTNLVILICVVFGISGDNTIHLTYVIRQKMREGLSYDEALKLAWRLIGVAMIGTSGAFLCCLPVFLLGNLKLFNQIAIFLSVAFLAAFFADTIVFPAFQIKMGWSVRHGDDKQRKII